MATMGTEGSQTTMMFERVITSEELESEILLTEAWTFDHLKLFNHSRVPMWVSWPRSGSANMSCIVWANVAAIRRFGKPFTWEEGQAIAEKLPDELRKIKSESTKKFVSHVLEKRQVLRVTMRCSMLADVFSDVKQTEGFIAVLEKPIKMLINGKHEILMFGEIEESIPPDHVRTAAMQSMTPLFSYLFDRHGNMLQATQRAITHYNRGGAESAPITLKGLFKRGLYDGEADMMREYNSAMHAIFVDRVPAYKFIQERLSVNNLGQRKFSLFEMWPMQDPVTLEDAVLVSATDVTAEKELELELQAMKVALQNQNQRLVAENADINAEKEDLQRKMQELASLHLTPVVEFDTDTPADKVLKLLDTLIHEEAKPDMKEVFALHNLIAQSNDLRQPVQLQKQLLENVGFDSEVGQAMAQLLQGSTEQMADIISAASTKPQTRGRRGARTRSILGLPAAGGPGNGAELLPDDASDVSMQGSYDDNSDASTSMNEDVEQWVPTSITPEVERLLREAERSWQFDIFALSDATYGSMPLSLLTFYLLKQSGVVEQYALGERRLASFLRRIEEGYKPNPYHNRIHAAGVTHMMHMIITSGGLIKSGGVEGIQILGCYIAAACHDYEHQGVNNDFLIRTHDPLALTYNDQSIWENHHLAASFRLLQQPQYNFIEGLSEADQLAFRSSVIEQVLATDMKRHFNILSRFQALFQTRTPSSAQAAKPLSATNEKPSDGAPPAEPAGMGAENKLLAALVALKCADLGHLAAQWDVHHRWTLQLQEEFFQQGDMERHRSLPVSPLMDRQKAGGVNRSQLGFFEIVALPIFRAFVDAFPDARPMLASVEDNFMMWCKTVERASQPRTSKDV